MTAGFTWQALNALAFFFKQVCGVEEVDFEWFWLFPARQISVDPESGIMRRHHLHGKVYNEDITTTEIYLHVATGANGLGVVSPLDRLGG